MEYKFGEKEVHYEGWLIKSPPTKRIWRARWRRRWFTLKQGEIPEQFCLEYYTDRNCRKLKGVIDLDQCEQVDSGLRLENRKQKFPFMFAIQTPKRTFYLAADTAAEMRDWVNCICQVCHLNELQDDSRLQHTAVSAPRNPHHNNIVKSSLASSSVGPPGAVQQSLNVDILRRPNNAPGATVVERQPLSIIEPSAAAVYQNNDASAAYVNTDYGNRETLLCEMRFDRKQVPPVATSGGTPLATTTQQSPPSPEAAIYLNSSVLGAQSADVTQNDAAGRLVVNPNGVVRKIPENLVLNNTPLPETQHHSIQPSPALSTSSGPYIPISECFSGSPKFILDGNNPTTPLNNLDPKFYDTPRSHNNIGLNLTNDQSYSPKITNCSLQQQISPTKNRSHRSDSDSESVFTDDDEWTHPLPLRENIDRSTRPSDSSVENESFVLTYSQRFSKQADEAAAKEQKGILTTVDPLANLAKVLKNKNNLILDFKDDEKAARELPQLSDTENTSPAIGPRDATSVVEESYDIPRSHNLPYYNMVFKKASSVEINPVTASSPNLLGSGPSSPGHLRTLPRPHCYTNAAPSRVEGNVFRYDFIEQGDVPPVNRKLKPKVNVEDKPPEEVPAKPPVVVSPSMQPNSQQLELLAGKFMSTNFQSPGTGCKILTGGTSGENSPLNPPSVDRKLKPNAYKLGHSSTLSPATRRSSGAPLSMVLPSDSENYVMETRTLPRQPRINYKTTGNIMHASDKHTAGIIQHQRTASAAATMPLQPPQQTTAPSNLQPPIKQEHKLQYFDLDMANPPTINRQSLSVGNLYTTGTSRLVGLPADPSARVPIKSSVVYNSVDFVKTEAFKRIREERKKENEGVNSSK